MVSDIDTLCKRIGLPSDFDYKTFPSRVDMLCIESMGHPLPQAEIVDQPEQSIPREEAAVQAGPLPLNDIFTQLEQLKPEEVGPEADNLPLADIFARMERSKPKREAEPRAGHLPLADIFTQLEQGVVKQQD